MGEPTESTKIVKTEQLSSDVNSPLEDDTVLLKAITKAKTKQELQPLYDQFKINSTKKEAIRVSQLNTLLDKVNEQALERVTKRPDELSNKDLIDYMNAFQNQIERSQKVIDGVDEISSVQISNTQNNTINVKVGDDSIKLSNTSRGRITDVIAEILKESSNINIPTDTIDISKEDVLQEAMNKGESETNNLVDVDDDSFEGDI